MQEKRAGKLKGVWFGASLYNLYLLNKTHWTTGLLYDENGNTVYFLCDIRSGPKYNPNIQFHMTISATHYTYARFVCPMELTFSNTKSKQQPEKRIERVRCPREQWNLNDPNINSCSMRTNQQQQQPYTKNTTHFVRKMPLAIVYFGLHAWFISNTSFSFGLFCYEEERETESAKKHTMKQYSNVFADS